MYLVVGLGNPEQKYFGTRHNAGFHAIDYLSQQYSIPVLKLKCKSLLGEGSIGGKKVVLAKPQTYMNNSGEAVSALLHWYKADAAQLIIIYDDVSLPSGKLRIREKGSDGGHNGIKSILQHLGTDCFDRIKIGVGSPPGENGDMIRHVLGKFSKQEQELIFEALKAAGGAVEDILQNGAQHAMNLYNGR